jgi:hypothetical protein
MFGQGSKDIILMLQRIGYNTMLYYFKYYKEEIITSYWAETNAPVWLVVWRDVKTKCSFFTI